MTLWLLAWAACGIVGYGAWWLMETDLRVEDLSHVLPCGVLGGPLCLGLLLIAFVRRRMRKPPLFDRILIRRIRR